MSKIVANFSHYIIENYDIGDCTKIERMLSTFDARRFRLNPIGFAYNEEAKELRIPRGFPANRLSSIMGVPVEINEKPQKYDSMEINLIREPRESLQTKVIAFLCGLGRSYAYTKSHSQLFCDLNTGKGKTYCVTAAMSHFKHKTVIFTPSRISKIATQWYDSILSHTNKRRDSILIVQGSKTCDEILEGYHDDKDVFIFSRATVLAYAKKNGWDTFRKMIEKTRAGIKVIDEAHLDFRTNVLIDCYTNIKRNIYLTSSAGRGNIDEDKVFRRIFDTVPIVGKELTTMHDNHIIMIIFKFNHKPSMDQRLKCKTREGLSAPLYSEYLCDRMGARYDFFTTLDQSIRLIFEKYRTDGGKLLILGSTREFLRNIGKFLDVNYPQYSIGNYTSDVEKSIRELELEKDVILATEKGLGTGADIPNLQFMINLIPYSNKIYADQLPGRLRDIGKNVYYMEIVNSSFPEASSQFDKRSKYLERKSKGGKLIIVNIDDLPARDIEYPYTRNENGFICISKK